MRLSILFNGFLVVLAAKRSIADSSATSTESSQWASNWRSCPSSCDGTTESSEWDSYHDIKFLTACNQTMLMDLSVHNSLDRQDSHVTIRACTASNKSSDGFISLSKVNSTQSTPEKEVTFQYGSHGPADQPSSNARIALQKLQSSMALPPKIIDFTTLFAISNNTVVGMHIGQSIKKDGASASLSKLIQHVDVENISPQSVLQYCGLNSDHIFGIFISTSGDLSSAQDVVRQWTEGTCQSGFDETKDIPSIELDMSQVRVINGTSYAAGRRRSFTHGNSHIHARGTCSTIQVSGGDYCAKVAAECGISLADFQKYNPDKNLCDPLMLGRHVCCSAGTLPDFAPKPNSDGTCKSHYVTSVDTCSTLAAAYSITEEQLETFNKNTWGWMGCGDLQAKSTICLSSGDPPMPATVPNAVCGPQMNDTKRPTDGTPLESLNPCPLNACCDIWGQCGITNDFCTASESTTGAPGTAKGGSNGCISHCGTDIVNNDEGPDEFRRVGYFEAFNWDRSCLNMDIASFDTSKYTHVHFAFAQISSSYGINISGIEDQFQRFTALKGVKRVLSFGGWSFSTSQDSFPIFRQGVTEANRKKFAQNVVDFLDEHDLDGVDFDWEYPSAPDIPGIPAGSKSDGPNYLQFLKEVKGSLPKGRTLSIATPASFWYLKGFPISEMSKVVDYIIYMTYDLHGQWDYDHHWAVPDCPNVDTGCLRSHVNLTETRLSLSMVTKAGVPSNKVVVGVSSYGRSFQMAKAGCTGSDCAFTGPESGAKKGRCTDTAGYISNAEIDEILKSDKTAKKTYDQGSDSNIVVFGTDQWIAYMDDDTKISRTNYYKNLKMGGTSDWAVDLQQYSDGEGESGGGNGGELLYISPTLWQEQSPAIACEPPCTFVMPPYPIKSHATVSWPNWTTSFLESTSGEFVSTKTKILTVEAFVTDYIDIWPITVQATDTDTVTIQLTQSIKPPPFVYILEPGEATFPPSPLPTPEETFPEPAPPTGTSTKTGVSTSSQSSHSSASTSSDRTIAPLFFTTRHTVTLQPQPTISISTPSITLPFVTYSSGSPTPTTTAGCEGCGTYDCKDFGCDSGCGTFACGGGCGIFGCGGGCGLLGCGGGCESCGGDSCPLQECAGGCEAGQCGENPRSTETECSELKTATNCAEYCTVTTNAAHITTTSCTSSVCVPTMGCTATGTTTTITSESEADVCPTSFPSYPTSPDGMDPFQGCKPCFWPDSPSTVGVFDPSNPGPNKRDLEKRDDGYATWSLPKVGRCPPVPTAATITWSGGGRFLDEAVTGQLDADKLKMPRWLSKITADCVPTITTVNDAAMTSLTSARSSSYASLSAQSGMESQAAAMKIEIDYQQPTNDHVWERNWIKEFYSAAIGNGGLTCEEFNQVFFTPGCSGHPDLFGMVLRGIANNDAWDFVGMTHEVNDQIKGLIGDSQTFNDRWKKLQKLKDGKFWGKTRSDGATVPPTNDATGREKLKTLMNFLAEIAMSCDVWAMDDVWASMDASNNRIYSAFIYVDEYSKMNHADNPGLMPETDLSSRYQKWMNERVKLTMFGNAKQNAVQLWNRINAQFSNLRADAVQNPLTFQEYENLQDAFGKISAKYHLGEGDHVCDISKSLTWKHIELSSNMKRDLEKRGSCQKPQPTKTTTSTVITETSTSSAPHASSIGQFDIAAYWETIEDPFPSKITGYLLNWIPATQTKIDPCGTAYGQHFDAVSPTSTTWSAMPNSISFDATFRVGDGTYSDCFYTNPAAPSSAGDGGTVSCRGGEAPCTTFNKWDVTSCDGIDDYTRVLPMIGCPITEVATMTT